MQSDRQPKVVPVVRVARAWAWVCPMCSHKNFEPETTVWNAADENKHAKVRCLCGQEVELSL